MGLTWDAVCDDPQLQDLPYKIELNGAGEIILNAARVIHAFYVEAIQRLLRQWRPDGFTPPEFPIQTQDGVRSPDVVWISAERKQRTLMESSASIAPEICIEVMSPDIRIEKMFKKRDLYLAAGAREVWLCSPEGDMRCYSSQAEELPCSRLVPDFPAKINIMG